MSETIQQDSIEDEKKDNKTDLVNVSGNILYNINYKVALFIFFIGLIIFSDVFVENILVGFNNAVYMGTPTSNGTMLQLLFLTGSYIFVDLIVKYDII